LLLRRSLLLLLLVPEAMVNPIWLHLYSSS
jgi:hypothetical protein